MLPCADCLHKGICKFEEELKTYHDELYRIPYTNVSGFSVNVEISCKCSRKQSTDSMLFKGVSNCKPLSSEEATKIFRNDEFYLRGGAKSYGEGSCKTIILDNDVPPQAQPISCEVTDRPEAIRVGGSGRGEI